MTNSQRLAIVRACLNHWLHEQGETGNPILRESILIRNDFYCGRRFHGSHFRAVWFIEEDQLKIYDADGENVAVFTGDEIDSACQSEPKILKLPEPNDETEIRRAA